MEYTVKKLTFPDLSVQWRIYHRPIKSPSKLPVPPVRVSNPFDDHKGREVDDFNDLHVNEVSLKRTKSKIYMYARSNVWDWFVTFTFAPDKVDRYDYDACTKKLSKWLNNLRSMNRGLSYVVVPERHKDGAWHFHGLFSGLDEKEIVWTGKYVIKKIVRSGSRARYVRTGDKIYRFGHYRFGWMTATAVKDTERATSYITKYVTKDMLDGLYGRKRYWVSRNLLLPHEEVFMMDDVDRFILSSDLEEDCKFSKVSCVSYGDMVQTVRLYEI